MRCSVVAGGDVLQTAEEEDRQEAESLLHDKNKPFRYYIQGTGRLISGFRESENTFVLGYIPHFFFFFSVFFLFFSSQEEEK